MNRKQRRAAAAHKERITGIYKHYVKHLPEVPWGAPFANDRLNYVTILHDPWCRCLNGGAFHECNCQPTLVRHVEPVRS